ncbi:DEAD/DEAH box helicase [Bifidobacterium parmae]|uniref:DEAD/DEAH box helicase n=1 Tax=Bifidobacterium parmae TaxID=361854 RepID=A0A2N5IWK7_9BIFI|nr:DEAD/DEAH box helicase [Bifidobacterium parmae]PLS26345.1 DEAD/DEAH box helicase [Bifidobacterium parmae]
MPDTTFPTPVVETRAKTFLELGVPEPLCRVLDADGKTDAFPIQEDTLPDSLAGRDILGRGRTGSGKTLAFCIPLAARLCEAAWEPGMAMSEFRRNVKFIRRERLAEREERGFLPHPRGLVLAPTRELANQINDVLEPLARMMGMTTTTVYGGVKQNRQVRDLKSGADIVVACPGRLEDLLRQKLLTLSDVRVIVMDEADEMADMGFLPPVRRILGQIRPDAQHMLFSATLDHGVDGLVREFLREPKTHSVDEPAAVVDTMTQHVFEVAKDDKFEVVRQLAAGTGKRILFTRTKFQAKKLAKSLTNSGVPAAQLHGNLNQNQRDRNLAAFEDGDVNVLVATDVAARGIDVSDVELVVQIDPPDDPKSFVHRSGRTARAGHTGDVVTLVLPFQRREAKRMLKAAGIDVKPIAVRHDSPEVQELVGERAPIVKDWSLDDTQPAGNPRKRRNHKAQSDEGRNGKARSGRRGDGGAGKSRTPANITFVDDFDAADETGFDDPFADDGGDSRRDRRGGHDDRRADRSPKRSSRDEHGRDRREKPVRKNRAERRAGMRDAEAERRDRRFETGDSHRSKHGGYREETRSDRKGGKGKAGDGGKRIHRRDENRVVQDERGEAAKRHDRRMIAKYGSTDGPHRRHSKRKTVPFRNR